MTGKLEIVFTLTALTLVWAVGDSSLAQSASPHPALLLAQEQQAPRPTAQPSQAAPSSPQNPQLANEKHPTKPLPPEIVEDGSMSHVGHAQSYPDLPSGKSR